MSFPQAVRTCLTQYATFRGRASRSEYWWFQLFWVAALLVGEILDAAVGGSVFTVLAMLGLLLPELAVTVRRLHDTGHSGWWYLIALIPFGGLVLLVFTLMGSQGPNRYGPGGTPIVAYGWETPAGQ